MVTRSGGGRHVQVLYVDGADRPIVVELTNEKALVLLDALNQGLDGAHGVFDEHMPFLEQLFDAINQKVVAKK
jgi:hypothetical protein